MTQHFNTCTHITCDASAQQKPWSRLDSDKDTFHSFHSKLPWRQILMLGFRFRCIIFVLRPLGYRCGTECVRKRDCYSMVAKNKSTSFREACRCPARSPLLERIGYASNGHHCATYKNGFPEQQSNSTLMMSEQANPVTALKNETTSELRANPPLPTTVLFHFHYFYVLLTFERAAKKKTLTSNGRPRETEARSLQIQDKMSLVRVSSPRN